MRFTNVVNCIIVLSSMLKLKQKMVVLSIQVCVGLKVVKDWGLYPIIERSTLEDIFKQLKSGELEGVSRVLLPEIPDDAEYKGH